MQVKRSAFLFDLDGTLLDTAPDLLRALNQLRHLNGLHPLPLEQIRSFSNGGAKAMIKIAFNRDDEDDQQFQLLREHFFELYEKHIAHSTTFFPNVNELLSHLEAQNLPWGIVTNKLTRYTYALLKALKIDHRPACIVCGDTTSKAKPSPLPLLYACEQLSVDPKDCLFVGDAKTDIQAGKSAGMPSLVALYGYIPPNDNPHTWGADGYLNQATDLLAWIHH